MLPHLRPSKSGRSVGLDADELELSGGPLFHTVELSTEDKRPSYMPYERISFPRVARESSADPVAELGTMWMVGFLDHEKVEGPQGPSAAAVRQYELLFQQKVSKAVEKRELSKRVRDRKKREEGDKAFTKEERERLEHLEAMFKRDARKEEEERLVAGKLVDRLKKSAYVSENRKIRKALGFRGKEGKKLLDLYGSAPKPPKFESAPLENLAYLEKLEQQAAVVIQRAFRRFMRMVFWRKYLLATKSAIAIQRTFRGYLIRKMVREWVKQREKLITKAQAVIRGKLARDATLRQRSFEESAATDVQRIFRGYLVRVHARELKRHRAATKIQALWRGVQGRARADRRYLHQQATLIQKEVRRVLQQRKFTAEFEREHSAARRIQALFRAYVARVQRNELLWLRETGSRQQWMALLRAEERFLEKEIARRVKLRAKANLEGRIEQLDAEWAKLCDQILLFEFDLISMQNERLKLSPRAIQQGWSRQLKLDVKQHREWVTDHKARALFDVARDLRRLRAEKDSSDRQLGDLLFEKKEFEFWWADERVLLWRRENERKWAASKFEAAKKAADEKRRWQVRHFTDTGKPDLRRPAGRPWNEALFPHAQPRTLTIAHGDIMALTDSYDATGTPRGSDEARQQRLMREYAENTIAPALMWATQAAGVPHAYDSMLEDIHRALHIQADHPGPVGESLDGSLRSEGGGAAYGLLADGPVLGGPSGTMGPGPSILSLGSVGSVGGEGGAEGPPRLLRDGSVAGSGAVGGPAGSSRAATVDSAGNFVGFAPPPVSPGRLALVPLPGAMGYGGASGDDVVDEPSDVPTTVFESAIRAAKRGEGPMPSFLQSGLYTSEIAQTAAQRREKKKADAEERERGALASLPPGLLGARRAEAAAAIAAARATGRIGATGVRTRKEERRREIEEEMEEFRRAGYRVQRLTEQLGAVSGLMETQQYGAMLKPLFDNMGRLLTKLRAAPADAAETDGLPDPATVGIPAGGAGGPSAGAGTGAGAGAAGGGGRRAGGRAAAAEDDEEDDEDDDDDDIVIGADGRVVRAKKDDGPRPPSRVLRGGPSIFQASVASEKRGRPGSRGAAGHHREEEDLFGEDGLEDLRVFGRKRGSVRESTSRGTAAAGSSRVASAAGGGGRGGGGPAGHGTSPIRSRKMHVGFDVSEATSDKPLEATLVSLPSPRDRTRERARRRRDYASTIPWSLLDELEAEKDALKREQSKKMPFDR